MTDNTNFLTEEVLADKFFYMFGKASRNQILILIFRLVINKVQLDKVDVYFLWGYINKISILRFKIHSKFFLPPLVNNEIFVVLTEKYDMISQTCT